MRKYTLHWALHPEKDQVWYENECKRRTEDAVARELDINYALSVSGKVFNPFKEHRHVTNSFAYNPSKPIYRIWDFGRTNATLYAQIDSYHRKRILHERVLGAKGLVTDFDNASNTIEQLRVALSDSATLFPDAHFVDICDPSGSFEDHRGSRTEIEVLQEEGIFPMYDRILSLPVRERKHRGRELILKDLQETPGGQEAFSIYVSPNGDAGCPTLKKAFQGGYCYKKDANGNLTDKIKEPNHPYEDVIDCLLYLYLETEGYAGVPTANYQPIYSSDFVNPYTDM